MGWECATSLPKNYSCSNHLCFSDRCQWHWLGHFLSKPSQGLWSREQGVFHINVRELYVVHICLTIFCSKLSDVHIQVELNNVTAVAYVNQMGGSKAIACDLLARKIWSWCIARNIWLSAVHIPGCTNVKADLLSINCYSDHDWQLNRVVFQKLRAVFLALSIDLFCQRGECPVA